VRIFIIFCLTTLLTSCGFHLQGEMPLAPPLHHLYLQTPDPYGQLARDLEDYLKMSHVTLVATPAEATAILVIRQDYVKQTLLSVSGTQQTRQYNLIVTVEFEVTDQHGAYMIPLQRLSESKAITVQSDQILGSSNEASLYYQQMRRALAYAIMNRIASKDITQLINQAYLAKTSSVSKKAYHKAHETHV
jgi:LPS-assembly lipoprotein